MEIKQLAFNQIEMTKLFDFVSFQLPLESFNQENFSYQPLTVIKNDKIYYLADGYLRFKSLQVAATKTIPVIIFDSTQLLTIWRFKLIHKYQLKLINYFELAMIVKTMSLYLKLKPAELWEKAFLKTIISNLQILQLLLEMLERRDLLKRLLPEKNWTLQLYKSFQKLSLPDIEALAAKFNKNFCGERWNAGQWQVITQYLLDLKRKKKQQVSELLELVIPENYSQKFDFYFIKQELFKLKNPVTAEIYKNRLECLKKMRLPNNFTINFADSFENNSLIFSIKSKNIEELKKTLFFFNNKIKLTVDELEKLFCLI